MKAKTLSIPWLMIILIGLSLIISCKEDNDADPLPGNATLTIKLGDNPAEYDEVNVEILRLNANINGSWHEYAVENPGIYNLLEFNNGNTLLLLRPTIVTAGSISELRLILGDNNSIVVDGNVFELKTPSGQTSGYKVKMATVPLSEGVTYSLVLDFDVNKSIHPAGVDKYILQPVVTGYLENVLGKLSGIITPVSGAYYVNATNATDTAGTYINQVNGSFLISTLNPGTYNVHFYANPGFLDKDIYPVVIVAGDTLALGSIMIDPVVLD